VNSRVGETLEVVDKNELSQIRVATVKDIIGKRLHVEYVDSSKEDGGNYSNWSTKYAIINMNLNIKSLLIVQDFGAMKSPD
jgi:hypothetical protein